MNKLLPAFAIMLFLASACAPAQLPLQPAVMPAELTATARMPAHSVPSPVDTQAPTRRLEPSPTVPLSPTPTLTTENEAAPTPAPLALRAGSLTYDPERGEAIYFGGSLANDCSPCGVTWVWDGSSWSPQIPPVSPAPRLQPGLAFDAARERVVLFGGWDGEQALGDTWLWDGETWVEASPPLSPSPRHNARMVYDSARQVILLFGGSRPEGEDIRFLSETWTWDGQTWMEHPSGELSNGAIPQPSLAYDSARKQVVLWQYGTGTWTWDGQAWTRQEPAVSPDLFVEGVLGYEEARGQVILWHPRQGDAGLINTWAWDGASWSPVDTGELAGPPYSAESYLVFDERLQALLLFAVISQKTSEGCPGDCFEMSVWALTGGGWEPLDKAMEHSLKGELWRVNVDELRRKLGF